MFGFGGSVKIYYCPTPVNMRKSFDGLAGAVEEYIKQDPESGHVFAFFSSGIFGGAIQSYIDLQKSLGKEFNRGNSVLREFDYLIAEKFNNTWKPEYFEYILTHFSYLSKSVFRRTILIIRNFLVYYSRENDNIFVPSTHMLPREEKSKVAYIISQKDIAKCLSSLKQLPSWTGQQMRAESSYMGIVLLYTCGLRINEMRQLRLRDFSFENQSLFIRKTKFHKERLIPGIPSRY